MSPDDSAYQIHVDEFMSIFFTTTVHNVEEFLHKHLRVVDEIDWHKIGVSGLNLFLSDTTGSLSFFFV